MADNSSLLSKIFVATDDGKRNLTDLLSDTIVNGDIASNTAKTIPTVYGLQRVGIVVQFVVNKLKKNQHKTNNK